MSSSFDLSSSWKKPTALELMLYRPREIPANGVVYNAVVGYVAGRFMGYKGLTVNAEYGVDRIDLTGLIPNDFAQSIAKGESILLFGKNTYDVIVSDGKVIANKRD